MRVEDCRERIKQIHHTRVVNATIRPFADLSLRIIKFNHPGSVMIAVRKLTGVLTTLINQSRRAIEWIILRQRDRHIHAKNLEKKTFAD